MPLTLVFMRISGEKKAPTKCRCFSLEFLILLNFSQNKNTGFPMSQIVTQNENKKLVSYSKKDKKWDNRKRENQELEQIFYNAVYQEFERYGKFKKYPERLLACAMTLWFSQHAHLETGEAVFKLAGAEFCRIRHCPVCQSRLSMKWIAKFHQIMPKLEIEYPKTQFLLLTLTVPNCKIDDLRSTIQEMNTAWNRMANRAFFKKQILGYIRATEVTRNAKDKTAHPHFHVLLHVSDRYFDGRNYIKRDDWLKHWQDAMRDESITQVDIRKVRESKKKTKAENLVSGALEIVKYATKHDNISEDAKWFMEYVLQVDRLRFMATGGTLKNLIADLESDDLIHIEEDGMTDAELSKDDGYRMAFGWDEKRNYRRDQKLDKVESLD